VWFSTLRSASSWRRSWPTATGRAIATLGETGLIEVISIIGYYTLIGNTLNVFQVALPEGAPAPFPE
jgi:4-carboxymuconolactone decarboxylase